MSTAHLQNAIAYLQRGVEAAYMGMSTLRGEMATYYAEQDLVVMEQRCGDAISAMRKELLKRKQRDEWIHWKAQIIAESLAEDKDSTYGFIWYSERAAKKALAAINAALLEEGAPWPEWALKAKAEGWTAPEGWKP